MAKLPNVKKKNSAQEDLEEKDIDVTADTEEEEDTGDQSDALNSVMSHATQNAENAGADEEDAEEDATSDEEDPAVAEHSEDADPSADESEDEKDEADAGENPETAPPRKDDVVVITPPPAAVPKPTTVKVATVCDHSCHIGGVPYHFKKGVITPVPEPVKEILRNAGLLAAL